MSRHFKTLTGCIVVSLATLPATGCFDFRVPGPEDPSPVSLPTLVSVDVQYRQPNGCESAPGFSCDTPVVFFGTWMPPGAEFPLTRDPGSRFWTGTAVGVPVNFPPRDVPYEVRIFDPFLRGSPTVGFTARRLIIGTEAVETINNQGSRNEHGLIYIDHNGQGRSPF